MSECTSTFLDFKSFNKSQDATLLKIVNVSRAKTMIISALQKATYENKFGCGVLAYRCRCTNYEKYIKTQFKMFKKLKKICVRLDILCLHVLFHEQRTFLWHVQKRKNVSRIVILKHKKLSFFPHATKRVQFFQILMRT
jgi:hypothetical protein